MAGKRPIGFRIVFACLVLAAGALLVPAFGLGSPGGHGTSAARPKHKPKKHRCRPTRHHHVSKSRPAKRRPCRRKPHKPSPPKEEAPHEVPRQEAPPNQPPSEPPTDPGGPGGGDGGGGGDPEEPGGGGGDPEYETVDLISDPGFEDPGQPQSGCFAPFSANDGSLALDATTPIAGAQSLAVKVSTFGRVGCVHEYGFEAGPIGKSIAISAQVRIDKSTTPGAALAVCAVVYFEDSPEPSKKCEDVHSGGSGVQAVDLSQDAEGRRLARVFLQLEAFGTVIEATLDEAHLQVEQVKGSEGPRGGGGGGGGGGGSGAGRFAAMVTPTDGETFGSPLNLRLIGIGHDPNIFTNENENHEPAPGKGTNAASVAFYLDGNKIFEQAGPDAEYHVFKGFAENLAVSPGEHEVWEVATYKDPVEEIKSDSVTITVEPTPAYAQTVNLTEDVVLGQNQSYELLGAPGARIRLNANGHRILAPNGTSGHLRLKYVNVYGLGSPTNTSQPGIDVTETGSGSVEIEHSVFDSDDPLALRFDGTSTSTLRDNLFRSNMRMPIGQLPEPRPASESGTVPVIQVTGSSSAAKTFAGNNVGAAPVRFDHARNWTVGGATDADTNVLIGARASFEVIGCQNFTVEGNFVNHNYYGGWSQGQLMELHDSSPITVEHNVLMDSSWPVRGIAGEFAYNLVLEAGHEWMVPGDDAYIHHNLFVGGENDNAGIIEYYDNSVRIENNTFDGMLDPLSHAAILWEMGETTLDSNAFVNFPTWTVGTVDRVGGTIMADYNGFFNPQTTNYVNTAGGAHDLNAGASTNPLFAGPLPTGSDYEIDKAAVWNRALLVSQILGAYRARYTPSQGSPYIDAGNPTGGGGNDIGAIGAGTVNAADRFGSFAQPGWTPPAP